MTRRRVVLALVVLAAALIATFFPRGASRRGDDSAPVHRSDTPSSRTFTDRPSTIARSDVRDLEDAHELRITVEKPVVCAGEENLVTVRPGAEEISRVIVDGIPGMRVPVRGVAIGETRTLVTLVRPDGRTEQLEGPRFDVVACDDVAPQVVVERRSLANAPSGFAFRVRPLDRPIREVRWDFGDGSHEVRDATAAVHDYARRVQRSEHAYFLIRAEVTFDDGTRAEGRVSLELPNLAARIRRAGGVLIEGHRPERFPSERDDGTVRADFVLFHHEGESVALESVLVTTRYDDGTEQEEELPASALGFAELPAGEERVVSLSIDDRTIAQRTWQVRGRLGTSPAQGTLTLMRPLAPTEEDATPVPESLARRIRRARALLGKDVVSLTELRELHEAGVLDG